MKNLLPFLSVPFLFSAFLAADQAVAAEKTILIATWRGCEEACEGFKDYLTDKGVDVDFVLRDAGTDQNALPAIVDEARALQPDLLITWGTTVTRAFAGTLNDLGNPAFIHDIPLVFMIVADPVGSGIVESLESTGRPNVTGTYNRMPESVTIETIRDYLPGFSHLGLIYNGDEKNSVLKRDELQALSSDMNFALTALELDRDASGKPLIDDIAVKMELLKSAGVDFVYMGSSSFLLENAHALREASLTHSLPVLSPYETAVIDGDALVSVAARYYDIGRLAGAQAERILVDGNTPGDLPVARMTNFAVTVNLALAKDLKLYPPIGLLQIAETVK